MLKLLDESIILENSKVGDSFRPNNFAFLIIYGGNITLEINGKPFKFETGNVIIVSARKLYKIMALTNDLKVYILTSSREAIRSNTNININRYDAYRIANDENKSNSLKFDSIELSHILNQLDQLKYYIDSKVELAFKNEIIWLIVSTIIYSIFSKLVRNFSFKEVINTRKEKIVIGFIELLSENFRSQKELKFYAEKLNISVKYLSNVVREITIVPPTNFIADSLVNEAKILLLDKNNAIKLIAYQLGFADQYSFGKFFKKHTGLSPKHYRLQNKLTQSF